MTENKKEFKLSPDQFQVNEKGELVINNREIADLIRAQPTEAEPPEAGVVSVSVTISI